MGNEGSKSRSSSRSKSPISSNNNNPTPYSNDIRPQREGSQNNLCNKKFSTISAGQWLENEEMANFVTRFTLQRNVNIYSITLWFVLKTNRNEDNVEEKYLKINNTISFCTNIFESIASNMVNIYV